MSPLARRTLMLAPFGVALGAGAGFWAMLDRMQSGSFDPHAIGDPRLGKPMPDFALPGLSDPAGFSAADLRAAAAARPVALNFFASWCVPCAAEAAALDALRQAGQPIWGIAYEDQPGAAGAFLAQHGNPYARLARDERGRVAIDFGVYGVPETYLIDRAGIVRWHIAGPIDGTSAKALLEAARQASA